MGCLFKSRIKMKPISGTKAIQIAGISLQQFISLVCSENTEDYKEPKLFREFTRLEPDSILAHIELANCYKKRVACGC